MESLGHCRLQTQMDSEINFSAPLSSAFDSLSFTIKPNTLFSPLFFFFWPHQVLVAARRIFVMSREILHCHTCTVQLQFRLSWHVACGILVPQSGIKPMSPALQGRFLTAGPPRKSLPWTFQKWFQRPYIHRFSDPSPAETRCYFPCIKNPGTSCYWARQESYDHPWTNPCGQGSVMCWGMPHCIAGFKTLEVHELDVKTQGDSPEKYLKTDTENKMIVFWAVKITVH